MRNVTDVDDDILRKARELGVHYLDLAAEEMARFDANMAALGLLPVYREPRATSAIPEILSLVGAVLDGGHAYCVRGAVYFDMSSVRPLRPVEPPVAPGDAGPGRRARRESRGPEQARPAGLRALAALGTRRAVVGVALGPGTAGLARRVLGAGPPRARRQTVDLHGGGTDLVFPHHECEAAQSESVTGTTFSRHWMHVGMVGLDGDKMSKSLGNLVFVGDLLKEWDPVALRLALLAHHYRSDWDWEEAELEAGARTPGALGAPPATSGTARGCARCSAPMPGRRPGRGWRLAGARRRGGRRPRRAAPARRSWAVEL